VLLRLKIYGSPRSRAFRVLWMAEELRISYQRVDIAPAEAADHVELAALNPMRRIPAIDDEGFRLWESTAINLYLAKKHRGTLAPRDVVEDGLMMAWSTWAVAEVEPWAGQILQHGLLVPEEKRDPSAIPRAMARIAHPLFVLEQALGESGYLVAGRFTVADLNCAAIVQWIELGRGDLSAYPRVKAWLQRCGERPAAKAARAMLKGPGSVADRMGPRIARQRRE